MSEAQAVQAIRPSILPNQPTLVTGRIESIRVNTKGGYFFLLRKPAPDAYSMPALLEVSCKVRPGAVGDDWSGLVELSGTPNNYDTRDGDKVKSARNYLHAVE